MFGMSPIISGSPSKIDQLQQRLGVGAVVERTGGVVALPAHALRR
jgi:hypothetical protein